MAHSRDTMAQQLAERLCWQVARRDDARVARRLDRNQVIDAVYQLDEGALRDDCFSFLPPRGVVDLLDDVQGTAVQRQLVPCVQDVVLDGLQTLLGIERLQALPALLCSDEALMRLVGFTAHQVRHGVCHRGAATRQGPRPLPRCLGRSPCDAASAGPGTLVQRRHPGPGDDRSVYRQAHGQRRCHRPGNHGPV
jgi:hypothetical protein